MSITFNYEIVSVDEAARCMEVVYTADGHQTMRIGARLPFEGEDLIEVIRMYAPIPYWIEQSAPIQVPQVGAAGTVSPPVFVAPESTVETSPLGAIPSSVL
jgi:hypothetical protein